MLSELTALHLGVLPLEYSNLSVGMLPYLHATDATVVHSMHPFDLQTPSLEGPQLDDTICSRLKSI